MKQHQEGDNPPPLTAPKGEQHTLENPNQNKAPPALQPTLPQLEPFTHSLAAAGANCQELGAAGGLAIG